MKTGAIILSLLAATGLAIPMEQTQQAKDAQMMQQMQMAADGFFDPPRSGNSNIIADIFDTAACIFGSFVGSRTCQPSSTIVHVTGDNSNANANANSSTSTSTSTSTSASYQYSYSTDSDGNYHIQINPGGNKSNCTYTVSKDDAAVLANTINQLATKCLSK